MRRILGGLIVLMLHATGGMADEITPAEALTRVRRAVGYDTLRKQTGHVVLEGTAEYFGMNGEYRLQLSRAGAAVETVEAHGRHQSGFDGATAWERAYSRPPRAVDFAEAEDNRAFLAVRSHDWLRADGLFKLEASENKSQPGEAMFRLIAPEERTHTEIVVDTNTWLPKRASRPWVFGSRTWEFSEYTAFDGVKWPKRSRFGEEGLKNTFALNRVTHVEANVDAYRLPSVPSDVTWDSSRPTRVELKRTASGHLFVKPLLDGKDVGWFAFDTGTGAGMCISRKAADTLSLKAFGRTTIGGAGKRSEVRYREARSFELGGAAMKPAVMIEMPVEFTDSMSKLFGFQWGGTVGFDFLSQVVAELDLNSLALELHDPAKFELQRFTWHKLRFNQGVPCLQCRVEDSHDGWFQFDTGAGNIAIVHSPAVRRFNLLKDRPTRPQPIQGVGGAIDAQVGRLKSFAFAGRTASDVPTFFITGTEGALADPYTAGTFGAGILGSGTVILDYGRHRAAIIAPTGQ